MKCSPRGNASDPGRRKVLSTCQGFSRHWISSPEFLAEVSATVGHPAPRRAAYEQPYYASREGEFIVNLFQQATFPYGPRFALMPVRVRISEVQLEAWNRLINGERSPPAGLEWFDFEFENIAKRVSQDR